MLNMKIKTDKAIQLILIQNVKSLLRSFHGSHYQQFRNFAFSLGYRQK